MIHKRIQRWLALLLAAATTLGLFILPAGAETPAVQQSLENASTATLQYNDLEDLYILQKSSGGKLSGRAWVYTTDNGVTGPGYCVNHNLHGAPGKVLPLFDGTIQFVGDELP